MNATTQPAAKPAKVLTVTEDMPQRSTFDTLEAAGAFLNRQATELSDFAKTTFATRGMDAEGNFDPEVYTDDMRVLVAVLKNRPPKGSNLPSTVKAIVITPVPTLDSVLADPEGKAWLMDIMDKELNHVAVRKLREADDIETVLDQMPTTLKGYVNSGRESGGIMESFNNSFKAIIDALAKKAPAWAKARLTKQELKKALESAPYAAEYYPLLETRGEKKSLFVMAAEFGVQMCITEGWNPAIYQRWLETRDAKEVTIEEEDEDFDLDDLIAGMSTGETADSEATETTTTAE